MNSILNDMFHTDTESIGWGFEQTASAFQPPAKVEVEEGEEEQVRLLDSPEPDRKELLLCCCSVFKNETIKFLTK